MKVLVACEESQAVCIEFRKLGHEAYSCDILPCSGGHPEWHIQGDVLEQLDKDWDLMIGHPPCTYMSNAGIGWFNEEKYGSKALKRKKNREDAMIFFLKLYNAPIEKICIENPVGWPNSVFRKPDQVIHPFFFGDEHKKGTCLWLKNLPKLIYCKEDNLFETKTLVEPKVISVQYRKPGKYYKGGEEKKRYFTDAFSRDAKIRSKTFPGIAKAMAEQWGGKL
jgi:hypothetical protein